MLTESIVLSLLGGALGVVFAYWATEALRGMVGSLGFSRAHDVSLDATVLGMALGIAVVTGFVFGFVPALYASRPDLNLALKDSARGTAGGGKPAAQRIDRGRGGFVVGPADRCRPVVAQLLPARERFAGFRFRAGADDAALAAGCEISRQSQAGCLRAGRGARGGAGRGHGGGAGRLPDPERQSFRHLFRIPGWAGDRDPGFDTDYVSCTPDFLRTMGIPLRQGRYFEARDLAANGRAAIISEAMVRACFLPGENPLGRQLVTGEGTWVIVWCVAADVHWRGLAQAARPMVYLSYNPDPWRSAIARGAHRRASPSPSRRRCARPILELDPAQPVARRAHLHSGGGGKVRWADRRLTFLLLALFAFAALLLAGIGLLTASSPTL